MYIDIPDRPLVRVVQHGMPVWAEQAPDTCPGCGAAWGPGQATVGWTSCHTAVSAVGKPGGHRTYRCRACRAEVRVGHVDESRSDGDG